MRKCRRAAAAAGTRRASFGSSIIQSRAMAIARAAVLLLGLALASASSADEGVSGEARRAASNRESTSDADTQVLRLVQAVQGGVTLKNAWMRPAVAGAAARAYVDITSDTSLTLVGAK